MFFLTPHSFLFLLLYVLFLFLMMCVEGFYIFWAMLEMSTLVFMGMSFSLFKNNFSQLLTFFIIQTVSAFSLLLFYVTNSDFGFTLSLLLKLSMFPFHFWYLNIVTFFPNIVLFISSTLFKIPSLLLVYMFFSSLNIPSLLMSVVFTILLGAVSMVFSNDLRFIIISSSVANNSWFILSIMANITAFSFYVFFYSFFMFIVLDSMSGLSSSFFLKTSSSVFLVLLSLVAMAGMPPFPIFFLKMFSILTISFFTLGSSVFVFFVMLFSVFMLLGYLKYSFSLIFDVYFSDQNMFFNL